jgi:iron complex outermembrane receptor protein
MNNFYIYLRSGILLSCIMLMHIFAFAEGVDAANGKIAGTVKTTDGKPAADVTVTIKELNKATATKENGTYFFQSVKPGTYTIVVTLVGSKTEQLTVTVSAGNVSNADFNLSEQGVEYHWATGGHSGEMVPIYLYGAGAELVNGIMENADLGQQLKDIIAR